MELVHLPSYCPLPFGYTQVHVHPTDPYNVGLPSDCITVELPKNLNIRTTPQLSKPLVVADPNITLSSESSVFPTLAHDIIVIKRGLTESQLPAELTPCPRSSLPKSIWHALETVIEFENENFELMKVAPVYHFPPGVELVKGVFTQPCPPWLHLPSWVSLISFRNWTRKDIEDDEQDMIASFGYLRENSFVVEHEIILRSEGFSDETFRLPKWTIAVSVPCNQSVYSWSSFAPGLQSVSTTTGKDSWPLPLGHFLVERARTFSHKGELPPEIGEGVSSDYSEILRQVNVVNGERTTFMASLPPGVEIIHIKPTYRLPRGISFQNIEAFARVSLDF